MAFINSSTFLCNMLNPTSCWDTGTSTFRVFCDLGSVLTCTGGELGDVQVDSAFVISMESGPVQGQSQLLMTISYGSPESSAEQY